MFAPTCKVHKALLYKRHIFKGCFHTSSCCAPVRELGMGQGGFYTPSYGPGQSMHLRMMCLGEWGFYACICKHWTNLIRSICDDMHGEGASCYGLKPCLHPLLLCFFSILPDRSVWASKEKDCLGVKYPIGISTIMCKCKVETLCCRQSNSLYAAHLPVVFRACCFV